MTDQTQRPAAPGEYCTCGRRAVVVYEGGPCGPTGYCGLADGGPDAPCPWCGSERGHVGRCPDYTLTGASAREA